jgi:hypothetical protein
MESRRLRCKVSIKERANAGIPALRGNNSRSDAGSVDVKKTFSASRKDVKKRRSVKADDTRPECDAGRHATFRRHVT